MLDFFTIFSKGGLVLWCFQGVSDSCTGPVNALIRSVLLQVPPPRGQNCGLVPPIRSVVPLDRPRASLPPSPPGELAARGYPATFSRPLQTVQQLCAPPPSTFWDSSRSGRFFRLLTSFAPGSLVFCCVSKDV